MRAVIRNQCLIWSSLTCHQGEATKLLADITGWKYKLKKANLKVTEGAKENDRLLGMFRKEKVRSLSCLCLRLCHYYVSVFVITMSRSMPCLCLGLCHVYVSVYVMSMCRSMSCLCLRLCHYYVSVFVITMSRSMPCLCLGLCHVYVSVFV